jgi:ubiquinone biosynthesis protein
MAPRKDGILAGRVGVVAGRVPHVSTRGTLSRLNWRITLVQFLANAIVIGLLIVLLPGFELHATHELLAVLWLAAVFGVITALVRPALEFLFLPYVLQSLGLVMVAINAILLALLALTSVLEIKGIVPLLIGAVVAGVVGFFLDSVLGLTPPVLEDASVRAARSERAVRIAGVSERLRVMQLYGILLQYTVDLFFDWAWLRPVRRPMQEWLWRVPVPLARLPPQVKVRLLLEDLGPTYVKLGQILSSQGRALPREWEVELAKLQSEVRPFAYEDVRAIVTQSLGAPPETLYEVFSPAPLAAASLAQVHEATTQDGRRVAVKVQRPNIHEQLRSDIKILTRGAAVLERRVDWAADADLTGVVREFGSTLLRELDYTIEAYNTRRLERVLAKIDGVHVPAVEPALSSGRVLTLEFIDGVKSTDTRDMDAAGLDRQELARNFVRGAVQMVMIDGFFHADPHPGNVVVELASGRLTFLDAGMVGQLDLRKRIRFARFLLAFRDKDVSDLARTLRSLSEPFREPNESAFQREFERRIGPLIDQPPGRTAPLQKLVSEAVDVLRDAGYRLDPQLTLAAKAVAQAEAITSALVPEAGASDFAQLGGAALEELVPEAVNTDAILGAARKQAIFAVGEVAERVPTMEVAAARWIDQLAKGEIPVGVRFSDLDRHSGRLESIARLIAAAILLTGLLIGSAIAATTDAGKGVFRTHVSDAALVVYVAATAVAVAVVVVLLWRLVRAEGRRSPRRESFR